MSVMSRWENSYLTPPEPEAETPCLECYGEATLEINGKLLCDYCADEDYRDYTIEGYCCICGDEDAFYKVNGEIFCEHCFKETFRI